MRSALLSAHTHRECNNDPLKHKISFKPCTASSHNSTHFGQSCTLAVQMEGDLSGTSHPVPLIGNVDLEEEDFSVCYTRAQ